MGSVLGFMILPILIYYCCLRTPASATDESDEPGAEPVGLVIKEGSPQLTQPRRKKRVPMDLAYGSVPGRAYIFSQGLNRQEPHPTELTICRDLSRVLDTSNLRPCDKRTVMYILCIRIASLTIVHTTIDPSGS